MKTNLSRTLRMWPTLALSVVLGAGVFSGSAVRAQAGTQGDKVAPNAPAKQDTSVAVVPVGGDYVIGVDDVIGIAAIGHEDVTQTVTVLSDGKIHVVGIDDDIKAEGMTLNQLRDIIYRGLDKYYNNLNLSVQIKESHSRNVTIVGARSSGQYPLRKDMRVSTLIAAAGGLPGKLKLVTGVLVRNFKPIHLNIAKIAGTEPDTSADPLLQPNDQVILDLKEEPPTPSYSVLGAVNKPGSGLLPLDGSPVYLPRALAEAGGQTEKAALTKAVLIRNGKSIPVNLYPIVIDGKADVPEAKMAIEDGDVLRIPELDAKYMVLGDVNKPSSIALPEGRKVTVLQALSEAGGVAPTGDLRKAGIVHMVKGKPAFTPMDLQKMMTRADLANNVTMSDGDILFVPTKKRSMTFYEYLSPLFILSSLGFRPFN